MTIKPTSIPEWASQPYTDPVVGGDNIVDPPALQKQTGWLRKQLPPANYMNWLQNLHYKWSDYLNTISNNIRQLWGCLPQINATTPATHIDFTSGYIIAEGTRNAYNQPTTITKDITVDWEEEDGLPGVRGGFPSTLTLGPGWYHTFDIMKLDGTVDCGFDNDINAVNLLIDAAPSGYVDFKRTGSEYYDGSAFWHIAAREEKSSGRRTFLLSEKGGTDFTATGSTAGTPVLTTVVSPPGLEVTAHIHGYAQIPTGASTGLARIFIYPTLINDPAGTPVVDATRNTLESSVRVNNPEIATSNDFDLIVNTLQQIKYYAQLTTVTSVVFTLATRGWSE
jgi:hypothetical protein